MAREHWRDHEDDRQRISPRDRDDFGQADYSSDYAYDPRSRTGYRADEQYRGREDYGQADYSSDFSFDAARGRPYRRFSSDDRASACWRSLSATRCWWRPSIACSSPSYRCC